MDLEEMKAGWNVLNERLAQNEILNQKIIKEMIMTRTRSAYDKVCFWEWKNLFVILFVGCILFPGIMFLSGHPMKWISFVLGELVILVGLIIQTLLLYCLSRLKLTQQNTAELLRVVMQYKRMRWYNNVFGSFLGVGFVIAFMLMEGTYTNVYAIAAVAITLILGLLLSCVSLRWHNRKVKDIEQGLAELKEFEE